MTDVELVTRVYVVLIADIDRHGHPRLWLAQRHRLRFTQLRPIAFVRLSFVCVPVGKLYEVERKLASPGAAPTANHEGKKRAVLIGTSGVTLALVPDDAANRKRDERRDHRVVEHARIVLVTDSDCFRTCTPVRMFRFERELDF